MEPAQWQECPCYDQLVFQAATKVADELLDGVGQLELAVQRMKTPLLEEMSSVSEHSARINTLPCIPIAPIGGVRRRHRSSPSTRLTGFTSVIRIYSLPLLDARQVDPLNMCSAVVRA